MRFRHFIFLLLFTACSPTDARLSNLPRQLRPQAEAILNEKDEHTRAARVKDLIEKNAVVALDFILTLLDGDPSAVVRKEIIDELADELSQGPNPAFEAALKRRVTIDPDLDTALLALEELRLRTTRDLHMLLRTRKQSASRAANNQAFRQLAVEEQRWISLVKGAMLPTFFQQPPPPFSLKAPHQPIRVLAFGDFGDGSVFQKQVAHAMARFHARQRFDFAVTLGDNFYSKGMESPADPRWKTWWDELYDPLGIWFYASLGNHDWGFPNSPAAEVLYTRQSSSWRMPATYYSFIAGPTQFFALDTNAISDAQLLWLRDELEKSSARWKIVYGHHPIYSHGQHEDNVNMIEALLPALRERADIYLAGHDHDMQHLKPEGRLHFFIAGSGGKLRPIQPGPRSLFAKSARGFAVLEANGAELSVRFIDSDLNQLYLYILRK